MIKGKIFIKGIPAAPGLGIGKAFCLGSEELEVEKQGISESQIPKEITRFEEALIKTRSEILDIQKKISKEMGMRHAQIFDAHLLVLEDRTLIEGVIFRLKKEKLCIDYVFLEVLRKYIKTFSHINDPYLRERLSDIEDVGKRILRNLRGIRREILSNLKEKLIIVAYDLSPSDTASMHKEKVIGFITDIGGKTSHTAIMAKALEIPAVVGLEKATARIRTGDTLIVDGTSGEVVVNPDRATLNKYKQQGEKLVRSEKVLLKLKDLPAVTLDGHEVHLAANIELPEELPSVLAHGAWGIGLYRTEYFYMNRADLPSEDEHFAAYKKVSQQVKPYPVVIRTLDLGGDKFLSQLHIPHEMNPYLGWRAIRFCLARPDIFKVQLRAVLRASAYGKLKLMYPMISGIEELRQANQVLEEVKQDLRKHRIAFDKNIEVGAMIEIPSAALTCDILAREADFFSIGTNDLIQYAIAVDRVNEKIAYLYEPTHPAVLRLIKNIIDSGHRENIWVGMCGEMASEPAFALLLLGLELDEFSASSAAIPAIKRVIRSANFQQARELANQALTLTTGKEVEEFSNKKLKELLL
ncbi:MAG: phosphoenolpyruvate--protein phosphotransferase [Candidatus Omnitrophica bacterium]|nr:phosphoenolpyruvate--protein phosphotransferase [Candidatus Omnitrophota bacterium]